LEPGFEILFKETSLSLDISFLPDHYVGHWRVTFYADFLDGRDCLQFFGDINDYGPKRSSKIGV
jgi:hypothetical protein